MSEFVLPDLGEGLQEAEIVSWHVSEGENVVADQPLVSVETDKAVVEIPSPRAGHITKLFAQAGDDVLAFADMPADDLGFLQTLAQIGQYEFAHDRSWSSSVHAQANATARRAAASTRSTVGM